MTPLWLLAVLCALWIAGLVAVALVQFHLSREIRDLKTYTLDSDQTRYNALNARIDVLAYRLGTSTEPPPPSVISPDHEHQSYIYRIEQLYDLVPAGLGTHRSVPSGTQPHHACRICSTILD